MRGSINLCQQENETKTSSVDFRKVENLGSFRFYLYPEDMSRSFTVKPAVSYSQGRGRGNQAPSNPTHQTAAARGRARGAVTRTQTDRHTTRHTQTGMNPREQGQPGEGPPSQQQQPGGGGTGLDQRMSYQGGFTMIAPDERRRQEVSAQARQGVEAYERYSRIKGCITIESVQFLFYNMIIYCK